MSDKLLEEIVENDSLFTNDLSIQPEMYEQIEKDLQKQEHLNRNLIKKELEFK